MNSIPYQIDIGHAFLDAIRTYDDLYIYIYISVVFVVCWFLSLHTKGLLGGSVKAPFIKSHCLSKGEVSTKKKRGTHTQNKKNKNETKMKTLNILLERERERERDENKRRCIDAKHHPLFLRDRLHLSLSRS